ncbi:hypothetical protein [Brevibacillus borstelensis]|uniref:hypothetical protein n=1 Tax=Brevibacillus borstelensis TaxID=45462 RepID=UPI00287FB158|nr:hypothetical protein [Brevibacillus borstelensis]WNF07241.1 hypothetical protein RFB14_07385 [Brevibacillus borstelensis]
MNVYEINGYWIAAKDADEAFGHYLDDSCFIDDVYLGQMIEDTEEQVIISVRRVREKEKTIKNIPCCEDGCDRCAEKNDQEYDSMQDIIDRSTEFPRTLAIDS